MDRRAYNLLAGMRELILPECSRSGPAGIIRVEMVIPRTDAVAWLRAQNAHTVKMYWADRDGRNEIAGVGAADLIVGGEPDGVDSWFTQVQSCLDARETAARYFGGMRFNGGSGSDEAWRDFGGYRFVLAAVRVESEGLGQRARVPVAAFGGHGQRSNGRS